MDDLLNEKLTGVYKFSRSFIYPICEHKKNAYCTQVRFKYCNICKSADNNNIA